MPLSSLHQRIITALLLVATLATALIMGGYVLTGAVTIFSVVALHEFYSMFWQDSSNRLSRIVGLASGAGIIITSALVSPVWMLLIMLGAFWLFNFRFLFSFSSAPDKASYHDSLILFAGLVYIPVTLQFITSMNSWEILFVLLSASASDTVAFYAGTFFGKKKIWPAISPKKSWAGSFGGFIGCIICCTVFGKIFGHAPIVLWVTLAASLNIAAQMGDFFESALKRKLQIKDSGKILPGHGGVLDRIDSLVLALPVYILARQTYAFF
ncbi:phosphatidate cytidylyltransferase [Maridesulfovibrio zosterae]|uniref:phosphatidate cytidylyltransferase n=1 Tax=Maridesulfovibrio zosterae TaxID=82171 RepID=UPI0004050072|nr:phosphatidate cytidylyltransferase [Maridesulfovibrio zosterae]